MEVWKDIPGFDGLYQASPDGRIRSWKKLGGRKKSKRATSPRMLTLSVNTRGYLTVTERRYYVHRLILETFVGKRRPDQECRHLDGDKRNNNLNNLTWGTRRENIDDNHRLGVYAKGSDSSRARLTEDLVKQARRRNKNGETTRSIARWLCISPSTAHCMLSGSTWKHVR